MFSLALELWYSNNSNFFIRLQENGDYNDTHDTDDDDKDVKITVTVFLKGRYDKDGLK